MNSPSAGVADLNLALPRTRVRTRRGLVAAASHDEDVITLGARAAAPVLEAAPTPPGALLLASVSTPFAEGGSAQVLAESLDIHGDLHVQEHAGTVAAIGSALVSAAALLAAGTTSVLLIAADVRRDQQGRALGDGAVAILLVADASAPLGSIEHVASRAELFRDHWRLDGEAQLSAADRTLRDHVPAGPADDAAEVLITTDGPQLDRAGVLGCPALLVAAPLRLAELGADATLDASVSAGGVTHRFRFTGGPDHADATARIRTELEGGAEGDWPALVAAEGFEPFASQPRSWRERGQDLRLEAQRVPDTGEILYPPVPGAIAGDFEPYQLARHGVVRTLTRDHIYPHGGPLTMAVVDLEGGGRFFGQVVDGLDPDIGSSARLVLRRLHDGGGLPQYFWKVEPYPPVPHTG